MPQLQDPSSSSNAVRTASPLDRRQFLKAAGGLLLAFSLEGVTRVSLAQGAGPTNVTAWIRIGADESITILVGSTEMGQGALSGLAQIAAEELMVDWSRVNAELVDASLAWIVGGSSSIRGNFDAMRLAGATAREMLIAAAAQTWSVPASSCAASHGAVTNLITTASLTYGQLAPLAATMPVPSNPPLKDPATFTLIGKSLPRTDIAAKTNGSAVFGIDVVVPGMVFAVIRHAPAFGGTLKRPPKTPHGALAAVPLDNAVAVVAHNTWQANRAADNLSADWSTPSSAHNLDSKIILKQAQQLMTSGTVINAEAQGDVAGAFANAAKTLDATYTLPYLAHAYMEVLNCTVSITSSGCDIWAPTQAPGWVVQSAAAVTGLPASNIRFHATLLGGGLGRKIEQDYIVQAVRVAKAIGRPVKLTWPREEDMSNDQYRPMALINVRAALDAAGNIAGWAYKTVSPSILYQRGWIGDGQLDSQATDGATGLAYAFGARQVDWVRHPAGVPVGFWRSVGHSLNCFAVESALDEVAAMTGADPLALRQQLLAGDTRRLAVLNAAASLGGWGTSLPAGHARGLAFSDAFGSLVAEVVEISHPNAKTIRVHNVACVIDCGTAVNPDSVEAQMQGGIYHGLSAALWGEVKFRGGSASVHNWGDYRVLLMKEAPHIDVQIIQSGAPLGGVGEPGVPPVAPAVANAFFRLTGQRIRTLPFFPGSGLGEWDD